MTAPVESLDMGEDDPQEVELRCPTGPRKLFAKLRLAGVAPVITPGNLIELSCQDCRRRLRSQSHEVKLVLHRYDITGSLVETLVVEPEN